MSHPSHDATLCLAHSMLCDRLRKASSSDAAEEISKHMSNLREKVTPNSIHDRQMALDYSNAASSPRGPLNEESDPNAHDGTLDALHDTYSAIGSAVGINVSHPEGCHHRIEFKSPSGDQAAEMVASHLADHGARTIQVSHYGTDHKIVHFYDGNVPGYARVQKQGDKYAAEYCR